MATKEYRLMWREYIRYFGYQEAKAELRQGVAFVRDIYPSGAGRIMVETLNVVAHIKLQWYRLLSWGLNF